MNHHRVTHVFDSHRFDVRHSTGLPALATNRLLGFAASTIIGIFFPIFLFEFFNESLVPVFVWFGVMYVLRAPLFILAAKFFTRFSLVASMCVGTFAWLFYYLGPYAIERFPDIPQNPLILMSLVAVAISAAFYWTPFHVDFSKFASQKKRGAQEGVLLALQRAISMFAPLFGGWVIVTYSYDTAFLIGLVVIILSLIPLAFIPSNPVQYEYGFFETFRIMFSKKYRYLTLSMIGYGAESSVSAVVWPIFLFIIFDGDHLSFGTFAGAVAIVGIVLQFFMGRYLDHHKKKKLLKWGVDFYALGWLGKAFFSSVVGVFAASTFHSFGAIFMGTPLHTLLHEKAADAGHYIDEFTTIREVATTIGRAAMMFGLIIVVSLWSINIAFVAAAIVSLLMTFLGRYQAKKLLSK
jgi:MFS family permease